jgi:hypothetical protein
VKLSIFVTRIILEIITRISCLQVDKVRLQTSWQLLEAAVQGSPQNLPGVGLGGSKQGANPGV